MLLIMNISLHKCKEITLYWELDKNYGDELSKHAVIYTLTLYWLQVSDNVESTVY